MKTTLCVVTLVAAIAAPLAVAADNACPFQPGEVQSALGASFQPGKANPPMSFGGMTINDCRYESKNYSLVVKTTAYDSPASAKTPFNHLAGRMKAIPNDPDGAMFQVDQGDLTSPTLHYVRGKTAVELRIMGIYYSGLKQTPAELSAMQLKLAKLPRLP